MAQTPTLTSWATRIALRDGTVTLVRHVDPDDESALLRFLRGLSPASVYLRFCCGGANLRAAVTRFMQIQDDRVGIVACDVKGEIVGHAEYLLTRTPGQAEVAIVVADQMHGKGLGRQLVQCLAAEASEHGVEEFVATVLPSNTAMLRLFMRSFGASVIDDTTLCDVSFATAPKPPALCAA
jgi:RimJ/RimL family protein N-acetyltransferase